MAELIQDVLLYLRYERIDLDMHNTGADWQEIMIVNPNPDVPSEKGKYQLVNMWGMFSDEMGAPGGTRVILNGTWGDCFKKIMMMVQKKEMPQLHNWKLDETGKVNWKLVDYTVQDVYVVPFYELWRHFRIVKGLDYAVEVTLPV